MPKNIYPVILCGGSGTRLWPLSRKSFPKQFLSLNSESNYSLLQQTQIRIKNFNNFSNTIFICNEEHRFLVAEQMREINVTPNSIIIEPVGRNTAPSIVLAALQALKSNKDPILLILSSDHLMSCDQNFNIGLQNAFELANDGRIVTFGIKPTSPNTGFGYIQSKKTLNFKSAEGSDIKRFIEKPNLAIAKEFILDEKYSWNSGMFVFKASIILSEMEKYYPEIVNYCQKSLGSVQDDLDFKRIEEKVFSDCPSCSIDVAIMEKTDLGSVVPLNINWTDIGSWKSLWEYEKKNQEGNVVEGKVFLKNVKESYFNSSRNRLLVGLGVQDLIVVDTDDVTFISDKNNSQEVKNLVKEIREKGMEEAENHKTGFRPWGNYLSIASDEFWQVKLIKVKPGHSLSLQKHTYRAEHWVVVKGIAQVRIEDKIFKLKENQSTFIPLGLKHQLSNPGQENLLIIEVQCGTYLGEDDIIRYEDKYGRN
tara:strand:- start:5266 stop:6702 length:1437 start_codon:yes stop_codon:yes gene_type:complete